MSWTVINPATEQVIEQVTEHTDEEIHQYLERVGEAFAHWRRTAFDHRSRIMQRVAERLRSGRAALAETMVREMGKPITAAEQEIDKCAVCCTYFAEQAEAMLAPHRIETDAAESYVRYDPLGPVLAIMPWNFPVWQVIRAAAPAIMAGNVLVLKHAPGVPGVARALEAIFAEAGLPQGVFTNVRVSNERAQMLVEHERIAAVTLTGSTRAGSIVAAQAGAKIRKTVLELGGSDPFIVLADADVEQVAHQAAQARCINAGQSCIAAKRFIIEQPVVEAFTRAFVQAMRALRVGDPMDRQTQIGPLARLDLLEHLQQQVDRSLKAGAALACGGKRLARPGYFYPPTVLTGVEPGMPAFDEETFGPVAPVITARDADHAIELANRTKFGLGASLWTRDLDRARTLAAEIEAGNVFINAQVKSDPRLPFGGIKQSGYGRELSAAGIREFVNTKTVVVG